MVVALGSWRLVEQPALRFKGRPARPAVTIEPAAELAAAPAGAS